MPSCIRSRMHSNHTISAIEPVSEKVPRTVRKKEIIHDLDTADFPKISLFRLSEPFMIVMLEMFADVSVAVVFVSGLHLTGLSVKKHPKVLLKQAEGAISRTGYEDSRCVLNTSDYSCLTTYRRTDQINQDRKVNLSCRPCALIIFAGLWKKPRRSERAVYLCA